MRRSAAAEATRSNVAEYRPLSRRHRLIRMARQVHVFDPPERFVAGTVGAPGERTFYLQATGAGRTISVALEKAQVALLAEKVGELLEEVRRRGIDVPIGAPRE